MKKDVIPVRITKNLKTDPKYAKMNKTCWEAYV